MYTEYPTFTKKTACGRGIYKEIAENNTDTNFTKKNCPANSYKICFNEMLKALQWMHVKKLQYIIVLYCIIILQ